jgi:hypothetical protein
VGGSRSLTALVAALLLTGLAVLASRDGVLALLALLAHGVLALLTSGLALLAGRGSLAGVHLYSGLRFFALLEEEKKHPFPTLLVRENLMTEYRMAGAPKPYSYTSPYTESGLAGLSIVAKEDERFGGKRAYLIGEVERLVNEYMTPYTKSGGPKNMEQMQQHKAFIKSIIPEILMNYIKLLKTSYLKGLAKAEVIKKGIPRGSSLTVGTASHPSYFGLMTTTYTYPIEGLSRRVEQIINEIVQSIGVEAAANYGLSYGGSNAGPAADMERIDAVLAGQPDAEEYQLRTGGPGKFGAFTMANMRGRAMGAASSSSSSAAAASGGPGGAAMAALEEGKEELNNNNGAGAAAGRGMGNGEGENMGGGARRRRGRARKTRGKRKGRKGTRRH